MARKLIALPGKEGDGQNQGQVLGPDLLEHQADSFGQRERRVGEGSEANQLQSMIVDEIDLFEYQGDNLALRVELQFLCQANDFVTEVFVQQMNCAHAECEEEDRLPQLEQADRKQAAIVVLMRGVHLLLL